MTILQLLLLIGGGLGLLVIGIIIGHKLQTNIEQRQCDQALYEQETAVKNSIIQLQHEQAAAEQELREKQLAINNELNSDIQHYNEVTANKEFELKQLNTKRTELIQAIDDLKQAYERINETSKQSAKDIEIFAINLAAENIEKRSKELQEKYREYEEKYQQDILTMMQEAVKRYQDITATAQEASDHALAKLDDLQNRINVIVETNKRAAQDKEKQDFYRLQLSQQDQDEIAKIRSIEPYLRSSEPLNKVIWKVYYEKPYTELIGRVLGTDRKTGIYKITSLIDGRCYVGQSTDVAERWKQHIKRGIGADTPTRNKLYPVMLAIGVENFTFELLEECPVTQLNDKEDYWQKVYHAIDFGYSIK